MGAADHRGRTPKQESYIARFRRMLSQQQTRCAPVIYVGQRRRLSFGRDHFPFASMSMLVILVSMFLLSMHLGGWTWSSWTYAFSLGIAVPLIAIEVKRRAIITGAAIILFSATALIAAGLPQYFGYSASNLSWYDLAAHFLGALALTVLAWSILCWIVADGGVVRNQRTFFILVITGMLAASITFELLEYSTDALLGWTNFHAGIDTIGDIIFDVAGVATAALIVSRHGVSAIRRPFWHAESPVLETDMRKP